MPSQTDNVETVTLTNYQRRKINFAASVQSMTEAARNRAISYKTSREKLMVDWAKRESTLSQKESPSVKKIEPIPGGVSIEEFAHQVGMRLPQMATNLKYATKDRSSLTKL